MHTALRRREEGGRREGEGTERYRMEKRGREGRGQLGEEGMIRDGVL